jgi:hypothetical protein
LEANFFSIDVDVFDSEIDTDSGLVILTEKVVDISVDGNANAGMRIEEIIILACKSPLNY